MNGYRLDDVDKELLRLLQENSRTPATDLAEQLGVSDNTVHNRIRRLEEAGIVTGYSATVDPGQMGLGLYYLLTCTARISERSTVAEQIREIPAVLEVTELMTGQENLIVKAVGSEEADITHVAEQVDQLNVEINDENLVRSEHTNHVDYAAIEELFGLDE